MKMHTTGDFTLHGGDTGFANRQKRLFDSLSDAEQECNKNKMVVESAHMDTDVNDTSKCQILRAGQKRKSETRRFRGRESIFKRPEGPAPRAANRSIPDYHKNPHKWMKYSLDDVSNDDMTEQSNTRAALSFLKELKDRRSRGQIKGAEKMDVDEIASSEQSRNEVAFKSRRVKTESTIEFKKPENSTEEVQSMPVIDTGDKPVFRSSKIIMPEYIVGQKQKKKNRTGKPVGKVDRSKQLKLDHLEEHDAEED